MSKTHKVLIVTGGSRGIGAATAKLAVKELGLAVCVNYAGNRDAAESVVAEIAAAGGTASAVQGDVGKPDDIKRIFDHADRIGTLAGLVNNAGIPDRMGRVDELDAARLDKFWAVNLTGTILCAGQAVRRMSTRYGGAGGVIVNLSSGAAKSGAPGVAVHYAASKGAVDSFTAGLALEVAGEGIRVNAVRPGLIDTDIHATAGNPATPEQLASYVPLGRLGTAEEVAAAVIWLLSEKSGYTTGGFISVAGGETAVV